MKRAGVEALTMRCPIDFFAYLRGTMRRMGLNGEEKYGLGVYFIATSRFQRNPLRLCIRQKIKGGASYLVRKVSELLPPGSVVEISPLMDQAWRRFAKAPEHKVVYISRWMKYSGKTDDAWLELRRNQLSRVMPVERDGRVVVESEKAEAPFVCIAREHLPEWNCRGRWLTMYLRKQPQEHSSVEGTLPLTDRELEEWHGVQRVLQERAQIPVLLPEWKDVVVEEASNAVGAPQRIPAFLQAWRTMAVFRSFLSDEKAILQRGLVEADFADFAATALLVKNLFWEGHWFPSPARVFNKVFPVGEKCGLLHPLTGKGIRYRHRNENPVRWQNLFTWAEEVRLDAHRLREAKLRDDE